MTWWSRRMTFRAARGVLAGAALGGVVFALWGCAHGPAAGPAAVEATPAVVPLPLIVPRFADITAEAGLDGVDAQYVNWLGCDQDGRPDLLVNGHRLFRNTGTVASARFEEITAAAGLSPAKRGPALAVDLDNDGWTDIVSSRGQLWRNRGDGTFEDVAAAAGFAPHRKAIAMAAGDIDGDGFADVYVAMGEDWNDGNPTYYAHELWRNSGGGHFTEIGEAAGIARKTYGRGVLFDDVDGDGRQDIFVANYRLQANLLWHNCGGGRFEDSARHYGVTGRREPERYYNATLKKHYGPHYGHSIGACWIDIDNDGRMDLFTANLVHKYVGRSGKSYDIRGYVCDDSAIYRRGAVGFEDWRERLGVAPLPIGGAGVFQGDELWAGCAAGDLNNDGWTDVFVPQVYNLAYATSRLFLNDGGAAFVESAKAAGIVRIDTYAGALADADGDGWLDVVTAGRSKVGAKPALRLYRNLGAADGEPARHWLRVRVRPGPSRRTVLGTRLQAHLGDRVLTRLVSAGSGTYGQQDDPVIHVGLGTWDGPVVLTARWPDGSTTRHTARPDSLVDIAPPEDTTASRRK